MEKSYEVLKRAITQCGAKSIASDMKLSQSMIYKWCQPSGNPNSSGADNPLDRLLEIIELTSDDSMVDWLCQQTNSYRVKNPKLLDDEEIEQSVIENTQRILKEFSELLEAVTESYANEQRIDQNESVRIRQEWEDLKSQAERFVCACESGVFDPTR